MLPIAIWLDSVIIQSILWMIFYLRRQPCRSMFHPLNRIAFYKPRLIKVGTFLFMIFDIFSPLLNPVTLKNPIDRSMGVESSKTIISLMSKGIGEMPSSFIFVPLLMSKTQTSSHLLHGMSKVMTARPRYMALNLPLVGKWHRETAYMTLRVDMVKTIVTSLR